MRPPSTHWLREIESFRTRSEDDTYTFPTYPWLAPPLHPAIRTLIERWGTEKHLSAGDPVLGHNSDRVDKLVLVKSGITGRCFGSYTAVTRPAVAFSVPGRLACGNLNFFTHRPCIGSYYAIVPSVVLSIPQSLLFSMCEKDPKLLMIVATEFELMNLSDRMGFGVHSQLGVEDKLLAFFLTWTVAFGREEIINNEPWARIPLPLRGTALQDVVNCSTAALERAVGNLKQSGQYVVEGDTARILLSALHPIHKWMRNIEEKSSELHREPLSRIISDTKPA